MSVCPIKCLEIPIDVVASHAQTRIYKYKTEQINTILKPFFITLTNTLSRRYAQRLIIGYYYPINKESNFTKLRFIAKPKH